MPDVTKRSTRLAIVGLTLFLCQPPSAQYFGGDTVQYENFNFEVLRTPHFDIYFYPVERDAAALAGRMAERWYWRFIKLFNHQLRGRQAIILYASHPDFEQT